MQQKERYDIMPSFFFRNKMICLTHITMDLCHTILLSNSSNQARKIYDEGRIDAVDPNNPYENPMFATFEEYIGGT